MAAAGGAAAGLESARGWMALPLPTARKRKEEGWSPRRSAPIPAREKIPLNQKGRSAISRDALRLDGRSRGVVGSNWWIEQRNFRDAEEIKRSLFSGNSISDSPRSSSSKGRGDSPGIQLNHPNPPPLRVIQVQETPRRCQEDELVSNNYSAGPYGLSIED